MKDCIISLILGFLFMMAAPLAYRVDGPLLGFATLSAAFVFVMIAIGELRKQRLNRRVNRRG